MKININCVPDYENLEIIHKNALPARAYFIPAKNLSEYLNSGNCENRDKSERFFLLSGKWLFRYYQSPALVENDILGGNDRLKWDEIPVPSCWQTLGYEPPFYVNNDFTFPAIPPYVPNANPVGVYKKCFVLPGAFTGKRVILTFLGVASGFHVFVNGKEVGYSQGSHNMSEFDVTDYLQEQNELVVFCYKWCDGSYLESQDMFRYNGIFRDVYMTCLEKASVFDFEFTRSPSPTEKGIWDCAVIGKISGDGADQAEISLFDGAGKLVYRDICSVDKTFKQHFTIKNPLLWSAETPNVYELAIRLLSDGRELECVGHVVGFKTIEYKGPDFRINGAAVKLKGVNRHDSSEKHGYTMTLQELVRDLELMKQFNVNTVRTAHYPPDPRFMELCDRMGFYVVAEADLESYGSLSMKDAQDYFGKNPQWERAFIDRAERLYFRDRNHVSVIMWSLGNEAGIGKNFDKEYEYLKAFHSGIPIHYETCFRFPEGKGYDIVTVMYPSPEKIIEWLEKDDPRPFFLCEYCHSMGLGPGGFKEYWDLVYRYDRFIGGCVWEWADHAAWHSNGIRYTYGGDHGEYIHDGNFCCDGLMYPDRTPSTSAFEMKNAYRPVRFTLCAFSAQKIQLEAFNTQNFCDTSEFKFCADILCDGNIIKTIEFQENIGPNSHAKITLGTSIPESGEILCNIVTLDSKGAERGCDSFVLRESMPQVPVSAGSALILTEHERGFCISNEIGEIFIDKYTCTVSNYKINGIELIQQEPLNQGYGAFCKKVKGFYLNIWRPATDNDIHIKTAWQQQGYHMCWTSVREFTCSLIRDEVAVKVCGYLSPPKYSGKFRFETEYRIRKDLSVKVTSSLIALEDDLPYLPKFGMMFEMPKRFENVKWYGLGDRENYPDLRESARFGVFKKKVSQLRDPYIRPQESGERSEVRRVAFTDDSGKGLEFFACDKPLYFNASHYPMHEVEQARHREDLVERNTTEIHIDGFLSGIGSDSCGCLPFEKYQVHARRDKPLTFTYIIVPLL